MPKRVVKRSFKVRTKPVNDGSGDVFVEIPPKIAKQQGWKIGDKIETEVKDGSIFLHKIKK